MFLIGLTGGIATGKSTVADIFKEHGVEVIDADVIARLIVRPGEPAWKEIREEFGQDVFGTDGELDREVLGKIIFSDVNKRTRLNRITHPKIQKEMIIAIIKHFLAGHKYVVLDIPLLFETETMLPFVFKVITASCDDDQQVKRLMLRNGYTAQEARRRIDAQMPLQEKVDKSQFVIDTSATHAETKQQTEKIISYLESSKQHIYIRVYLFAALLTIATCFAGFVYICKCLR